MNATLIMIFETTFNIAYLITIWTIVALMTRSMHRVSETDRPIAGLIRLAFILLAAGDTGHVGFRVLSYALGGLDKQVDILGAPMSLVGLGMLTTAVTVTFFYMLTVYIWRIRYKQPSNWFTNLLLAAGVVRLILMALPANDWGSVIPPEPMGIYRNLPLMLQGIGVMALILVSAYKTDDKAFKWIGWCIAISYAFYTPVILFARQIPLLGMLMIPKTCAYVAIAIIAYRSLWMKQAQTSGRSATGSLA